MGDYLKLFEKHSEYETYSGGEMLKPNVSYCEDDNEVHYNPYVHDYSQDYLTFVAKEAGTFTFTPKNNNAISYSTDNGESWIVGSSVEVNSGDRVLWKGSMTPSEYEGSGTFSSTANFDAQGNVMTLLFGDDFKGKVSLTEKGNAFRQLFYQNAKLVSAENLSLPATTLAQGCYNNMFSGCTSLTKAPELPATTLAIYCYQSMFYGCTALTTAPVLPATTLASQCYYQMFMNCTSLTMAPELPATTLTSNCYLGMFDGCTSLNYIKAMFISDNGDIESYTDGWVSRVAASGTFVKNSAATWNETGSDGIPRGWTVETASA